MASSCPDAASLQQLLDGVLPEATQAELTQREDPKALAACVPHDDVFDHG